MTNNSQPPAMERAKAVRKKIMPLFAIYISALVIATFTYVFTPPLRAIETVSLVGLMTLIPALVLGQILHHYIAHIITRQAPNAAQENISRDHDIVRPDNRIFHNMTFFLPTTAQCGDRKLCNDIKFYIIYGYLAMWALTTSAVILANSYFDTYAPKRVSMTVIDKYIKRGRGGTKRYNVVIESPVPTILPFTDTYREKIQISESTYSRIIVNQSTVDLDIHGGAFGLPWYTLPKHAY